MSRRHRRGALPECNGGIEKALCSERPVEFTNRTHPSPNPLRRYQWLFARRCSAMRRWPGVIFFNSAGVGAGGAAGRSKAAAARFGTSVPTRVGASVGLLVLVGWPGTLAAMAVEA